MSGTSWVYLDHAATTPVHPRVAERMAVCLTFEGIFGNASSTSHMFGAEAREKVRKARAQVAALIGAQPAEIVWTSGATEADNLAILGAARFHRTRGRHVVTVRTEHKAVVDACRQLEKEGFDVTYLKPDAQGIVHPGQVAEALTEQTALVSVMHMNNEIGVVQDIAAVGRICRARGVLFHVDAAQSSGKLPIDVVTQSIDLLSLSAHKMGGPKGIGALYVRRNPPVGLQPLIFGGGQEEGLRSGTLPTHQIVGMGEACAIAREEGEAEMRRLRMLRERLWDSLSHIDGALLNGDPTRLGPHILNVSFTGVEGESLIAGMQVQKIGVSSGAACSSASQEASYVLRALGRSDQLAQASLRFSLGRTTIAAEIERAAEAVRIEVARLRKLSPASEGEALRGLQPGSGSRDPEGWVSGEAGSVEQGTWVRFTLRPADNRVAEARFKVYGCPDTTAAVEWLVQRLPGRKLNELLPEGVQGMAKAVEIPAEKLGRLLLIEDALRRIPAVWPSP